jgi:hypothetical protein
MPESTASGEITFEAGSMQPVMSNLPVISEAELNRIGVGVSIIDFRTNPSGTPIDSSVVTVTSGASEAPAPDSLPQLNTVELEKILEGRVDQTVQVESGKETLANKRKQTPLHVVYPTEPGGTATHPELDFKALALIRTCNPD